MLKRGMLLLICAVLLGTAVWAFAEGSSVDVNGSFQVTCKVLPGYSLASKWVDANLYTGVMTPEDPKKPVMLLSIAYSELSNGRTLNDYSEEEIATLAKGYTEDMPDAKISYDVTGLGTKLIVIREDTGSDPHVEIVTIYKGYELSLYAYIEDTAGENTPLSEDDMALINTFLTDMVIEG